MTQISEHHIFVRFRYDWMNQIWERKHAFLCVFFVVVTLSYGILYALDFYPELHMEQGLPTVVATTTHASTTASKPTVPVAKATVVSVDSLPRTIIIDALNRTVPVLNPTEDTVAVLDNALLTGIARHPDSADFKKTGTMMLLGHSSYLPAVKNKNFQAFNGIQKLTWGDTIRVQSKDTEYTYRVEKVYQVKASSASADISWGKPRIILVTCNSFGSKDDRFVVEGYLVSTTPLDASAR
jgi:LPXTG-site transpeptidase (sortase) family protein